MKRLFITFFIFIFSTGLFSQIPSPVHLSVEISKDRLKKGESGSIRIACEIDSDFHLSDASSGMFEVVPGAVQDIFFRKPEYPQGEQEVSVGYVYRHEIKINVPFIVDSRAESGERDVTLTVYFQPCAETGGICYPPDSQSVTAKVTILDQVVDRTEMHSSEKGITGRLNQALEGGSLMAFLIVFLGGLLTSLTPCVYPMIPITLAVIGAQATGSKMKGFVLSLFYVLGISITFTSLGIVAAKTGSLFGSYVQHPVVIVLIASIFLLMGLSMLGVFVIQMSASVASKVRGKQKKGFAGALLTGLLAGLVVSPCISPMLVVILTWVARTGSVFLGAGLLFSFSLGLGVLFILIGTFSGIVKNLPKSGGWMELIERGFGVVLVSLAIVFLKPILPLFLYHIFWAILLIILGTFTGAFHRLDNDSPAKQKLSKAIGIMLFLGGSILLFFGIAEIIGFRPRIATETPVVSQENFLWIQSDEVAFSRAKMENKPVLIDFYADWCVVCHELDEKTWPDERVNSEINRYIPVKLNLTKNDAATQALQKKYKIIGMPTVIVFDPSGDERDRFEGFKSADEALAFLKKY